jgi:transposase-like protein
MCVRCCVRYPLSLRQVEEIMAERNLSVDHVTIWRWVQRYAPELNRRCRPELRKANRSWRVDETYCGVAGKWTYLYRAVHSTGAVIDFLLSATRDAVAAKRFLQKSVRSSGHPQPRKVDGIRPKVFILDEWKGRTIARQRGLPLIGALGNLRKYRNTLAEGPFRREVLANGWWGHVPFFGGEDCFPLGDEVIGCTRCE